MCGNKHLLLNEYKCEGCGHLFNINNEILTYAEMSNINIIPPENLGYFHKLNIVIGIDDFLFSYFNDNIYVKMGAYEFIKKLHDMGCELVIWSCFPEIIVKHIMSEIKKNTYVIIKNWIFKNDLWKYKNLDMLNRNMDKLLLLDVDIDATVRNRMNSVLVVQNEINKSSILNTILKFVNGLIEWVNLDNSRRIQYYLMNSFMLINNNNLNFLLI
jgi:hypothetical protein